MIAAVGLTVVAAPPTSACLVGSDEEHLEEARLYKADQISLVPRIAKEADQIVIGTARRWLEPSGWESEFLIERTIKGSLVVGKSASFRSSMSTPDLGCSPAKETFRNTVVLPGTRYLLYVSRGRLLRAAHIERNPHHLSLTEELQLVLEGAASNKSLERSRER